MLGHSSPAGHVVLRSVQTTTLLQDAPSPFLGRLDALLAAIAAVRVLLLGQGLLVAIATTTVRIGSG